MANWEFVPGVSTPFVARIAVPGGWLYRSDHAESLVFVPEPQGEKVPADDRVEGSMDARSYLAGVGDGRDHALKQYGALLLEAANFLDEGEFVPPVAEALIDRIRAALLEQSNG